MVGTGLGAELGILIKGGKSLERLQFVSTDLDATTVCLRYDRAQLSTATIEATLDDAGYTVAK